MRWPRFRGMFAFALWDAEAQRLVLARDAFGKKPLFLATHPGMLLFGSEIEPLVQFPGFDRTFNVEALGHYLLNRYVPGPATFFPRGEKAAARTIRGVEGRLSYDNPLFHASLCRHGPGRVLV